MTTHNHPFLPPGFKADNLAHVEAISGAAHCPHIADLITAQHLAEADHVRCHLMGQHSGPKHDEVIGTLDMLESMIDRGFKAVWS